MLTTFLKNRAMNEIMCKNIVEPGGPHMAIWRMRIACWVTKATNIHSDCIIVIAFPRQQWLHESASVLLYAFIACLVFSVFNIMSNFMKSVMTYEEEIPIKAGLLWVNTNERTRCRRVLLILLHTGSRSTFPKLSFHLLWCLYGCVALGCLVVGFTAPPPPSSPALRFSSANNDHFTTSSSVTVIICYSGPQYTCILRHRLLRLMSSINMFAELFVGA
jgi:hypothetical protein